jgi:manganese oxidase
MDINKEDQQSESTPKSRPTVDPTTSNHKDLSRRKLLGAAVVGGSLAVVGGAAVLSTHTGVTHASPASPQAQFTAKGQLREYWIQANSFYHNLVPTGYDGMMGMTYKPNQSSFWALGYQAYTPGWGALLDPSDSIGQNSGIPGPILRGAVGDTIRVHFRNNDTHYGYPHSMHPHGVQYTPTNDGAWFAADPRPGSSIAVGQSYTYEWQVRKNSVGTWVYHDHAQTTNSGMIMEFGGELGLFGFFAITDSSTAAVDKEVFTFIHDIYQADVPALAQDFDCFNGHSYVGNTPTVDLKMGQKVRWHVAALGKEFHVFHLHGHRWLDNTAHYTDTLHMGPSMANSFDFEVDNPGKWLYHCHVTDHMMGGMVGMYIAE